MIMTALLQLWFRPSGVYGTYLKNEPDRQWNKAMQSLLQEMIHYRNGLPDHEVGDPQTVADFEWRFCSILDQVNQECEDTE